MVKIMEMNWKLINDLKLYYEEKKKIIDEKIKEWIDDMPFLKNIVYDALKGGKRFRGILTLMICDALEGDFEKAIEFAASIEFTHAATLLHDDVLDQHVFRRGKYSLWRVHDIHKTIITGDFIFTYAGARISKISEKALAIISRSIYKTTLGILLEALPFSYPGPKHEVYTEVVKLKTGELFAGATELGALAAKDDHYKGIAYRYGLLLGEAYQIADDIFDLKTLTDDGESIDLKPIKLAIMHFGKFGELESKELWKINDAEKIITIAREMHLETKLFNLLNGKLMEIQNVLRFFPETPFKAFISFIPRYMVEAMMKYG